MSRPPGRPRTISPDAVSLAALRLFDERGFDAVSMDDVAEATGISRRSLFRLFPTKSALVWGGLDEFVDRFRTALAAHREGDPGQALRSASLVASRFPDDQVEVTRRRLRVIHVTPDLSLRDDPRLTALTDEVHRFLLEHDPARDDLAAVARAHAFAAVLNAALTWWAENDEGNPVDVLSRLYEVLGPV